MVSSRTTNGTSGTHVEDVEDPGNVLLPGSNLIFVALRQDESECYIPFTLLDDLLLDPCQRSAI